MKMKLDTDQAIRICDHTIEYYKKLVESQDWPPNSYATKQSGNPTMVSKRDDRGHLTLVSIIEPEQNCKNIMAKYEILKQKLIRISHYTNYVFFKYEELCEFFEEVSKEDK